MSFIVAIPRANGGFVKAEAGGALAIRPALAGGRRSPAGDNQPRKNHLIALQADMDAAHRSAGQKLIMAISLILKIIWRKGLLHKNVTCYRLGARFLQSEVALSPYRNNQKFYFRSTTFTRVELAGCVAGALLLNPHGSAAAQSLYAQWPNGPPQSPDFFPLAVWWQNPAVTGSFGKYSSVGAAAAGMKLNIFLGEGNWPEQFGADQGELEATKANNLYMIGGINTPYAENNTPQSVASVLALANAIGAQKNVIGYNMGDEPDCLGDNGQPPFSQIPADLQELSDYDPTRLITFNQTYWPMQPYWWGTCGSTAIKQLQSISIGSYDYYPMTNPALISYDYHYPGNMPSHYYGAKSDFLSVSNDTMWVQGVVTTAMLHLMLPTQPAWVFVEAGGDNLGFSGGANNFPGSVTSGSTTLVNTSGWSSFTSTWLGLTVSGPGIPANTTITGIIDATHAVLSAAATATSTDPTITITGGDGSNTDCVASANLCVANGNEYRPTSAEVAAEVWMSLISGANGIEYFCHDYTNDFFCMGLGTDPAALQAQENITHIDSTVLHFAPELNAPTTGICSMEQMNWNTGVLSTTTSCSNGVLTMATENSAVPGLAMVKQYNGKTFLFAQSDRRSPAGATFTYTLSDLGGKTATVVYDSDTHYDRAHTSRRDTFTLSGTGQFSDVLGANHDDYQVKIYRID